MKIIPKGTKMVITCSIEQVLVLDNTYNRNLILKYCQERTILFLYKDCLLESNMYLLSISSNILTYNYFCIPSNLVEEANEHNTIPITDTIISFEGVIS